MTLPNESYAGDPWRAVMLALLNRGWRGYTTAELGDAAEVHGRQLGGALRALRGLADTYDMFSGGRRHFPSDAAMALWKVLGWELLG